MSSAVYTVSGRLALQTYEREEPTRPMQRSEYEFSAPLLLAETYKSDQLPIQTYYSFIN